MKVPALQFPYRLPCRNRQHAAQEPKTWKFLRCRFTIKYCAGTGNVRRRNPRQLQNGEFEISCFFFTSGAVIPILQTGCVIIIAIDIDVHAIENHFKIWHELSSHRWVIFVYFFLRDGPGSGHCLYKQRNTPKQTRLRKTLLHYFWQSLRRKGQQGSVIVSALKIGFASRPIFSKVMLSSGKKMDHCLNASLPCLPIYECIYKTRSIRSTSNKQPTKDCTRSQAQILTTAKAITKHHLNHPPL